MHAFHLCNAALTLKKLQGNVLSFFVSVCCAWSAGRPAKRLSSTTVTEVAPENATEAELADQVNSCGVC